MRYISTGLVIGARDSLTSSFRACARLGREPSCTPSSDSPAAFDQAHVCRLVGQRRRVTGSHRDIWMCPDLKYRTPYALPRCSKSSLSIYYAAFLMPGSVGLWLTLPESYLPRISFAFNLGRRSIKCSGAAGTWQIDLDGRRADFPAYLIVIA